MEKTCFKCGATKPLHDFYKHHMMADGHVNKCKECNKADVRKNRADNVEYYRVYDRRRYDANGLRGELQPEEKRAEYKRRWAERNKHKTTAERLARQAIKRGDIAKGPCAVCGSNNDIEAHHEDYNKPLDVVWLCTYHHGLTRRKPRF